MDGQMVRSESFSIHNIIGGPVEHVRRMVQWDVDELIVIDISRSTETRWTFPRDDLRSKPPESMVAFIRMIGVECRIPLTFGGRIRTQQDVDKRIQNGADKVTINSALSEAPDLVNAAALRYGSQAIVCCCDYRVDDDGEAIVYVDNGTRSTDMTLVNWVKMAVDLGAGEIMLQNIDLDGCARGYDIDVVNQVCGAVNVPVIACSGAGHQRHFLKCYEETDVGAVAAGNIFHFTENAYPRAKRYLREKGVNIR